MNIETVREYCLSHQGVTEDSAFGPDIILFRIENKIFAAIDLERPDRVVFRAEAADSTALRERYNAVQEAYHWNKTYWNEALFNLDLDDSGLLQLLDQSLASIVRKLPKRLREKYAAYC